MWVCKDPFLVMASASHCSPYAPTERLGLCWMKLGLTDLRVCFYGRCSKSSQFWDSQLALSCRYKSCLRTLSWSLSLAGWLLSKSPNATTCPWAWAQTSGVTPSLFLASMISPALLYLAARWRGCITSSLARSTVQPKAPRVCARPNWPSWAQIWIGVSPSLSASWSSVSSYSFGWQCWLLLDIRPSQFSESHVGPQCGGLIHEGHDCLWRHGESHDKRIKTTNRRRSMSTFQSQTHL